MATNWTDATLFLKSDVVVPKNLSDLKVTDLDVDVYFEPRVKDEIGDEINYRFKDYTDFDIEEITVASITNLEQTALYLNLYYICIDERVSALETDTFTEMANEYFGRYKYYLKRKLELIEFDEPDGINERKTFTMPIQR